MTSYLPDINVWLALTWDQHPLSPAAVTWFHSLAENDAVLFCRFTQIGLLRLLTTPQVMSGDALTTNEAWSLYDDWRQDQRIDVAGEPKTLESDFRRATARFSGQRAPKTWGDAYLVAFATASGHKLVTFDRAMAGPAADVVMLLPGQA